MMDALEAGGQNWINFIDEPLGYIDSERLSYCFAGAAPADLCAQLKSNPRLRARLTDAIKDHYWLPPILDESGVDDLNRAIALSSGDRLQEIILRAGVIHWSSAIASTVLASEVQTLHDQIGEELCSYAIKHRDLSGPEKSAAPVETIQARIVNSGWRCMAAWCETLDPAISARVRLKLPPNDILDSSGESDFQADGPAIVRRAADGVV